jgi:hypothetical protein
LKGSQRTRHDFNDQIVKYKITDGGYESRETQILQIFQSAQDDLHADVNARHLHYPEDFIVIHRVAVELIARFWLVDIYCFFGG